MKSCSHECMGGLVPCNHQGGGLQKGQTIKVNFIIKQCWLMFYLPCVSLFALESYAMLSFSNWRILDRGSLTIWVSLKVESRMFHGQFKLSPFSKYTAWVWDICSPLGPTNYVSNLQNNIHLLSQLAPPNVNKLVWFMACTTSLCQCILLPLS